MVLARRVFEVTSESVLRRLLSLLRAIAVGGRADVSVANSKGETVASILGVAAADQHIEQQLTYLEILARVMVLPLAQHMPK
jgi:hypothetical protein